MAEGRVAFPGRSPVVTVRQALPSSAGSVIPHFPFLSCSQ